VWGRYISHVLSDHEFAQHLSVSARERAEHLDWARSGQKLLEVYRRLVLPGSAGCRHELAIA